MYLKSFADVSAPSEQRRSGPDGCPQPRQTDQNGGTSNSRSVETAQGLRDDFVTVRSYQCQRVD